MKIHLIFALALRKSNEIFKMKYGGLAQLV